jgi:hypothetical protein
VTTCEKHVDNALAVDRLETSPHVTRNFRDL